MLPYFNLLELRSYPSRVGLLLLLLARQPRSNGDSFVIFIITLLLDFFLSCTYSTTTQNPFHAL